MIPTLVAQEIRETLLDFLETTFALEDRAVSEALRQFLSDPKQGIFKGPYLQLRLPFKRVAAERNLDSLLQIQPPFQPYAHQVAAFERLSSKAQQPLPTLVTTGTGSGKTECFLYPLLDHCFRHHGAPGIKAIILYPMNALAADQARRLAKTIWDDERLRGRVSAGMYVGGKGEERAMGPEQIITDRDVLRQHPPDILLTNYKMLDFLLLRPEDRRIWKETGPQSLRYLVLDELHTYDGAQGSDVACLIRRLKARLELPPGQLCCVGTSATLAGNQEQAIGDLTGFAQLLFNETFPAESVVGESRLAGSEYLDDAEAYRLPTADAQLMPDPDEAIAQYALRQSAHWFAEPIADPVELGQRLKRHGFLSALVQSTRGRIVQWDEVRKRIAVWEPEFGSRPVEQQDALLHSFICLVNVARQQVGERQEPFVHCQVQLWIREMSRLMREVHREPRFFWRDDVPIGGPRKGLPAVFCRNCGHSGWLSRQQPQSNVLSESHHAIYRAYFNRERQLRYLFPGSDDERALQDVIYPATMTLTSVVPDDVGDGIAVVAHSKHTTAQTPRDLQHCPACDTLFSMTLVGSQAATLASVAISHLYQTPLNSEKKLLAFTDSVQDASHRAAFFAARTYRFNLRTAIQTVVRQAPGRTVKMSAFTDALLALWGEQLSTPELVAAFLPPDLRDLAEYQAYVEQPAQTKLQRKLLKLLRERLSWEIALEFGHNARVGRTLEKVRCSTAQLDEERLAPALEALTLTLQNEVGPLGAVEPGAVRRFVEGFLWTARTRGAIAHPWLDAFGDNKGNTYHLTKKRNRLISTGLVRVPPKLLTDTSGSKTFDNVIAHAGRYTWYLDYAQRCFRPTLLTLHHVNEIYRRTLAVLLAHRVLVPVGKKKQEAYAIPMDALWITGDTARVKSDTDGHGLTIPRANLAWWNGAPSLHFRADGRYAEEPQQDQSYYRNIYNSGQMRRIFTHEHSGLLSRARRERVETLFKSGQTADAPNLLTCTPTMEMGIDIGDLASTMLCSVPPDTSNYLQRIGRAGRLTGNALILAMAEVRPHDLYFFDNPFQMIAGSVTPPGCYLDAPEMLKRQYIAYCMDSWCRDEVTLGHLPPKVSMLLKDAQSGGFPTSMLRYAGEHRARLTRQFLAMFEGVLSPDNLERLRRFGLSDEVTTLFQECLARTEQELRTLRTLYKRTRTRLNRIEAEPEKTDNAELEMGELKQELQLLMRMIKALSDKYPLSLFTDAGLIPNYAFPESGVTLKSMIYGIESLDEHGKTVKLTDSNEYVRSASQALVEFAPYNFFYAEGRKIRVDQVQTGGKSNSLIEHWRFCNRCSHLQQETDETPKKTCPRCGSPGWEDVGQRRELIKLSAVSARVSHDHSRTADELDDRESQQYVVTDFLDVDPKNQGGGHANEEGTFGFEYLQRVTYRQVNFGLQSGYQNPPA